jgi:hypothetical protein
VRAALTVFFFFFLFLFFFFGPQVTNGGLKVTWVVVGAESERRDDFPEEEGPAGTKGSRKRQTQVLKGYP